MAELISAKYLPSLWATSVQFQYLKYWTRVDDPFRRLYQFHSFEEAFKIFYFTVLVILGTYGLHRLWMVYTYFKYRHNLPGPPPKMTKWPKVTVQLPIYNERCVIERLLDAVARLEYPRELLEIQVLDDSVDETQQVARARVEHYREQGLQISHLQRNNRAGFKAGAMAEGLESATGEFIAIFDADFIPEPDFLRRMLPYFADPNIALVQARWTQLNRRYSALTEIQSLLQDGHFTIEQGARSRSGVFFHFNGTAGVWRRTAIVDAGGWHYDTLSEDADLSYRAQLRGWKQLYIPEIECLSELPIEMNGFKTQQARWAKGTTQTAKKILPGLLRSDQPVRVKAEAFFHLTGYLTSPFMLILSLLLLPAMSLHLFQLQSGLQAILVNQLMFVSSTCSLVAFFVSSQHALHPRTWKRSLIFLPHLMAVYLGLSICLGKAVLEALFGVKSDFVRTPKFGIAEKSGISLQKSYRTRVGWMPYIEICLGLYFGSTLVRAVVDGNYMIVPVLLPFVWGFLYTGVLSVGQGWRIPQRSNARSILTPIVEDPNEHF